MINGSYSESFGMGREGGIVRADPESIPGDAGKDAVLGLYPCPAGLIQELAYKMYKGEKHKPLLYAL
jgi:hypothetical protein